MKMDVEYGAGNKKKDRGTSNGKYNNLQKLEEKCTSRNILIFVNVL